VSVGLGGGGGWGGVWGWWGGVGGGGGGGWGGGESGGGASMWKCGRACGGVAGHVEVWQGKECGGDKWATRRWECCTIGTIHVAFRRPQDLSSCLTALGVQPSKSRSSVKLLCKHYVKHSVLFYMSVCHNIYL